MKTAQFPLPFTDFDQPLLAQTDSPPVLLHVPENQDINIDDIENHETPDTQSGANSTTAEKTRKRDAKDRRKKTQMRKSTVWRILYKTKKQEQGTEDELAFVQEIEDDIDKHPETIKLWQQKREIEEGNLDTNEKKKQLNKKEAEMSRVRKEVVISSLLEKAVEARRFWLDHRDEVIKTGERLRSKMCSECVNTCIVEANKEFEANPEPVTNSLTISSGRSSRHSLFVKLFLPMLAIACILGVALGPSAPAQSMPWVSDSPKIK